MSKFEGLGRAAYARQRCERQDVLWRLEFLLDEYAPAELRPLANDALERFGGACATGGVVRREVERALRDGPCEVCNGTEVVGVRTATARVYT